MIFGTGIVIFALNLLATISKISKWRRKKSSRTERQKREKTFKIHSEIQLISILTKNRAVYVL